MAKIDKILSDSTIKAVESLYGDKINVDKIQIQKTRKDFSGDYTIIAFPLLAYSKKNPDETAVDIGEFLKKNLDIISNYNVVKGFLNISFSDDFWLGTFKNIISNDKYGFISRENGAKRIVIEYSSPNTNKPLHLGHVRNNFLGWSAAEILKANGLDVIKVNLVNDRGIHICKSMLAWEMFANGETPETSGMKGDHFVGKYYVLFDQEYKKEIYDLMSKGMSEKEAEENSELMKKARNMLKKWERRKKSIRSVWQTMNDWVYAGFDETYKIMGIDFDKIFYESDTYIIGKDIVLKGILTGELKQKPDGTVYINLAEYGMDEKVLLRADGTTVYMTQDIGTAVERFNEYKFDEAIYVVGNEQDYHFKVLTIVLDKLEYPWSNKLTHLSYGMVELPEGKMKSREGTVVDADDLIREMINTAKETAQELGKLDGFTEEEKEDTYKKIALGALKFFILKVDSRKNMTFNPKDSIDFNGNTGPFIQYTYVRIKSLIDKYLGTETDNYNEFGDVKYSDIEASLIKTLFLFAEIISEAGDKRNPAIIANYVYELAKEYNKFYHEIPILKENDANLRKFRLALSAKTGEIIKNALALLGIEVPNRM